MNPMKMRNSKAAYAVLSAAALLVVAGLSFSEPSTRPATTHDSSHDAHRGSDPHDRQKPQTPQLEYLTGTVQSYNLSPRGIPDGLIIDSDNKSIQVNCGPEIGMALSQVAPQGDSVKITGMSERSAPDHPVYRLIMLTNSKGQQIMLGKPSPATPIHLEGTVKSLNHGPRGEVDGAILESGDFVRVGPQSGEALKLAVGQKLTLDGTQRPMMLGHNVITPQTVNGFAVMLPTGPEANGPDGPPDEGPDGPRRGPQGHRGGPQDQG